MYTECFIVRDSSPRLVEHGNDLECLCLIKKGTGSAGVLNGHHANKPLSARVNRTLCRKDASPSRYGGYRHDLECLFN